MGADEADNIDIDGIGVERKTRAVGKSRGSLKNDDEDDGETALECEEGEEVEANDNDPFCTFGWILRCNRRESGHFVLEWQSPQQPTSVSKEEALLGQKLIRWGKKERGLTKNQPDWRKQELARMSERSKMPLNQVLSLRRHHIKRLNIGKSMSSLGLGQEDDIRESARLFEDAVSTFLVRRGIPFYSEDDQKEHIRKHRNGQPFPPTPDFIFKDEIIIEKCYNRKNRKRNRAAGADSEDGGDKVVVYRQKVCWMDAKMFYGASTIEPDGKSAVGNLLATARKYTATFGPGAFVFMHGYGDRLGHELEREGAMALDCSGGMFSLDTVDDHRRTWCGDQNGQLWP